jgi:4-hydroxyacetophenone monooxygenase
MSSPCTDPASDEAQSPAVPDDTSTGVPLRPPLPGADLDVRRLRAALTEANLPTLLMVLFQLTGERAWLQPPYRPTRPRGMDDHDDGGFTPAVQQTIREAAASAIADWAAGAPPVVPAPTGDLLLEMMQCSVAEDVPADYVPMTAAEMGFAPARPAPEPVTDPDGAPAQHPVAVIGAGFSGLVAAIRLREAGVPFVVFERADDVGGVWRDNRYPGAGVDTPSHLYSLSFFPRNWSVHFPKRDEVLTYVRDLAEHFDLRPSIRFGTEVLGARFDEDARRWEITTRDRSGAESTCTAHSVITAVGIFSEPKEPPLRGRNTFAGPVLHSARWPEDLDVTGQRVAVVGTGASAMQIVPAVADRVAQLTVFQRSSQWAAPAANYFRPVPPGLRWLFAHVPFYREWYRFRLAWTFNDKVHPTLRKDPDWPHPERSLNATNDRHRAFYAAYIADQLDGRDDLLGRAVPDYPPYGKRMLIDNGWFAALRKPNVELVADSVTSLTPTGVRTSAGTEYPVDTVVLCTGFHTSEFLRGIDIRGRGGRSLTEDWNGDDARAYVGIMTPGYPNLFFLYGPNTNGAGGSFLPMAESQVGYVVGLITAAVRAGGGTVEPREDRFEDYNRRMDDLHDQMVWTHPGMDTYYRNRRGRVVVNRPWSVVEYWRLTLRADPDDYVWEPANAPSGHDR